MITKCICCGIETNKKFCSTKCKSKTYNSSESQLIRGFKRKKEFVLQIGGKCSMCGYNKNLSCLTFHHTDPSNKKFQIDLRRFANCKFEKLQKELPKCILVCRNCHGEIEHPHFNNWQTKTFSKNNVLVTGMGVEPNISHVMSVE